MKQGFTLLELLVVIAIIGLLASIILVSYEGSTDKAKIAKTLSWAGSISHLLGANAVGVWTFDNITGTTVYDDSGLGNNGTIYNGAMQVDGVVGKALSFDGVNDYVNLGSIGTVANWNPDSGQTTITVWFNPASSGRRMMIFSDNCLELGITVESNKRACGFTYTSVCTPSAIAMDQWHFGVVVLDIDTRQLRFYLDSELQGTATFSIGNGLRDAPFNIGRDPCTGGTYFLGKIDDMRIYKEALPQARIEQLYADGLKTHQNLAAR